MAHYHDQSCGRLLEGRRYGQPFKTCRNPGRFVGGAIVVRYQAAPDQSLGTHERSGRATSSMKRRVTPS